MLHTLFKAESPLIGFVFAKQTYQRLGLFLTLHLQGSKANLDKSEADLHQFVQDIAAVIGAKARGAHIYTRYLTRLVNHSTNPTHAEDVASRAEAATLTDKPRPKIRALRYGKEPPRGAAGLVITNHGEPAYEVSIPEIPLGKSLLRIKCDIPRLTHSDGDKLCEAWIDDSPSSSTLGEDLHIAMVAQDISHINVEIRYKDDENRWYKTLYQLERNTQARDGLVPRYIGQQAFIPGRQAAKESG